MKAPRKTRKSNQSTPHQSHELLHKELATVRGGQNLIVDSLVYWRDDLG